MFGQQSQFGETFMTKLTWNDGLPRRMAAVYSAILSQQISLAFPSEARAAEMLERLAELSGPRTWFNGRCGIDPGRIRAYLAHHRSMDAAAEADVHAQPGGMR